MPIRTFNNYCTCGGFAWTMNGRNPYNPHMFWCPQATEYLEWISRGWDPLRPLDTIPRD